MILFPAIDLKNGQCVRLEQGDMARATVFNLDPAAQARTFAAQGFEYLHVVDLDGAFAGKPMNAQAVESMLKAVTMPVQLGGGIRDLKTVEAWLTKGIARVIIGTAAVRDPALVKDAAKAFPGRVAVGLDARDGRVAVEGWAETSQVTALEIAQRFEDAGVAAIIFTDIARDGLLKGLNLDATIELAQSISIPVIASGGFASIEDVKALLAPRAKKLAGAIAGRALYDGRLDAVEALTLIKQDSILSPREMEVWAWIRVGKTEKEVATILNLSEGTVIRHTRNLLSKLEARAINDIPAEVLQKLVERKQWIRSN